MSILLRSAARFISGAVLAFACCWAMGHIVRSSQVPTANAFAVAFGEAVMPLLWIIFCYLAWWLLACQWDVDAAVKRESPKAIEVQPSVDKKVGPSHLHDCDPYCELLADKPPQPRVHPPSDLAIPLQRNNRSGSTTP